MVGIRLPGNQVMLQYKFQERHIQQSSLQQGDILLLHFYNYPPDMVVRLLDMFLLHRTWIQQRQAYKRLQQPVVLTLGT